MNNPLLLAIAIVLGTASVTGQAPVAVRGTVVDGVTGRAIPGAEVRIRLYTAATVPSVFTDTDGNFSASVTQGLNRLTVVCSGYYPGGYGQLFVGDSIRPIAMEASHATPIVVRLWRGGSISGAARDSTDLPISKAVVVAWRKGLIGGRSRFLEVDRRSTDDRGFYSFDQLLPGSYRVGVLASAASGRSARLTTYRGDLFPGDLEVESGSSRGNVDFALDRLAPSSQAVFGNIEPARNGIGCERGTSVELISGGGTSPEVTAAAVPCGEGGAFRFEGVPPGEYRIRYRRFANLATLSARSRVYQFGDGTHVAGLSLSALGISGLATEPWGAGLLEERVEVEGKAIGPLRLALTEGHAISGRVVPLPVSPSAERPRLGQMALSVSSADGRSVGVFPPCLVLDDGTFRTIGLPDGDYSVAPLVGAWPGWTPASITWRGMERLGRPIQVLASDSDGVELQLRDRTPVVRGSVERSSAVDPGSVSVFVFPADSVFWADYGLNSPRIRRILPEVDGTFRDAVPPGDYMAIATTDVLTTEWQSVGSLRTLAAQATRIRVDHVSTQALSLSVKRLAQQIRRAQ